MASPVPDSYSTATGGSIYGGRSGLPAWRSAMVANTWAVVPMANTLADINPRNNAAINPNYPSAPEWTAIGSQSMIVLAWCGASNDDSRVRIAFAGGHGDWAGNECYDVEINADTPSWVLTRWPSGAIGNLLTTNDGQESTGVYADGQPRSSHTYNKPVYVPGVGHYSVVQGACSWSGAGGTSRPIKMAADGTGTLMADNPYAGAGSAGGGAYDSLRHALWYRGNNTGSFSKYDITADAWTSQGSAQAMSLTSALAYHPDSDTLLWGNADLASDWAVFDCATATLYQPTFSGTPAGGLTPGRAQMHWVPSLGAFVCWDNSTATTLITRLTPPANPRTGTWVIDTLPVSGANTVTPSAAAANGTYGRFFYSPTLDGFGLFNSVSGSVYFYALS